MAVVNLFIAYLLLPIALAARRSAVESVNRVHEESNGPTLSKQEMQEKMWTSIGKCIEPDQPEIMQQEEAQKRLLWDQIQESELRVDGWANNAWGSSWYPQHMIMGLVENNTKYPATPPVHGNKDADSECFTFDYSSPPSPGDDPAGCRIFKKSFQPLRTLRSCIIDKLEKDEIWTTRHDVEMHDPINNFTGNYTTWCGQAPWAYDWRGNPILMCDYYNTKLRAEEAIKFLLFKEYIANASFGSIIKTVDRNILKTVTWPRTGKIPSLEKTTVDAIRTECLHLEGSDPEQEVQNLNALQRRGSCLPLMYDKAELQGFGIFDGLGKFQGRTYYDAPQSLVKKVSFPTQPVCGRLALAMIPGFQRSTYSAATWTTLHNFDRNPAWEECLTVSSGNCRKAYFCWEAALNRVCGLSPQCCNQNLPEKERAAASQRCKDNPHGGLNIWQTNFKGNRISPAQLPGVKWLLSKFRHATCPEIMNTSRF